MESVSENLNDGVIAPIFYFYFLGIPGMMIYKILSTIDSMIGYKDEYYKNFGWFGAKFEDYMSYIPARLTWLFLSLSAFFIPRLSARKALIVGLRDYSKLSSPNSGWCEATVAGALQIKLGGPVRRDGKIKLDSWIGDNEDRVGATVDDINVMNKYALITAIIGFSVFDLLLFL